MKNIGFHFLRQNALALIGGSLLLGVSGLSVRAASHTWAGGGITGFWSLPANWAANNPPTAGEAAPVTIIFPAGASRLINTNNVGGLVINKISFTGGGYTLYGSGAGTNLTLQGGRNVIVLTNAPNLTNTISGTLNPTLASSCGFAIGALGSLTVNGITDGTGSLEKSGAGTMTFFGNYANTYAGSTYVTAGNLRLYCGTAVNPQLAVPGYLEIGGDGTTATVQLLGNSQLSSTATLQLNDDAVLDLNNNSAKCGPLVFNYSFFNGAAPKVTTGTGTLTLNGDVTGTGGNISGQLSLGGVTRHFSINGGYLGVYAKIADGGAAAGITMNGNSSVGLISSNSFSGTVTINSGAIEAADSHSFGTGAGGVMVSSNGVLYLTTDFMTISNTTLTLDGHGSVTGGKVSVTAAPAYWIGPVVLASDSTFENYDSGVSWFVVNGPISGPGGVRMIGGDSMYYGGSADNTYTGTTWITSTNGLGLTKSGGATAISGPIVVGTTNDPENSAYLSLNSPNQIANNAPITINNSGVFDLSSYNETIGPLTFFDGHIKGTGLLTLTGNVTNYGHSYDFCDITCPLSLGGQTRVFNTLNSDIFIYSVISDGGGAAGVTKAGGFGLGLAGNNTYSGVTTVNEGTLEVYDNHALGSTAAGTVLNTNSAMIFPGNVTVTGESLTVNGAALLFSSDTNSWTGPVTLAADLTCSGYFSDNDLLTLSGVVSGNGTLTMQAPGTLALGGSQANNFVGNTVVEGGKLLLQKPAGLKAVPGNLIVGTDLGASSSALVQLNADNQINPGPVGYVQVRNSGLLFLNNHTQTVPALNLVDNGYVNSGLSGLLTLGGDVTMDASIPAVPYILGNLSLGGANRTFTFDPNVAQSSITALTINAKISDGGAAAGFTGRNGRLNLNASNIFSGTVLVDNAQLYVNNSFALGATGSGVTLTNSAYLFLNASVTNETLMTIGPVGCSLTSVGSNAWTGPIQLFADLSVGELTNYTFIASGPVTGTANVSLTGAGTVRFSGAAPNTLSGSINSGINRFELSKNGSTAIYGPLQVTNGTVRLLTANQIVDTSAVTVTTPGVFDLNDFNETIGDFSGNGSVTLGAGIFTVGGAKATNIFSGILASSALGELDKIGANTLLFTGTNTYTGNTLVKNGTFLANGSQPGSAIYIYPGATLGGNGTVGDLYDLGGTISPGNNGPGKLNCGYVSFNSGSTFQLEIQGTNAGVNYDQLNVTGVVTISSNVNLVVTNSFGGAVSNQFVVLNNDLVDAVGGIFNGLTNGASFTASGTSFRLNFNGGSGNDIVLSQLSSPAPPPQFSSLTRLGNGSIQLIAVGSANQVYTLQASTNLSTTNWVNLGPVTANNLGVMTYTNLQDTNYPIRFYRISFP